MKPYTTKLILEVEFEVGFDAEKADPAVGMPAQIEFHTLKIDGLTLPPEVYYKIVKYSVEEITNACREALEEMAAADAVAVADADARNDLLRNR